MPYTAAQLTTYYQGLTGTAPDAATSVLLAAYAQQNANSTLTDAQTLALVFNAQQVQNTFEVAVSTYQFFTGTTLSAGGIQYLRGDTGAGNANGLNSAYYAQFNTENRYYNFAINLATTGGAGATTFASNYGALTFAQTVQVAYETIVGSSNVGTTAANAAIADIISRQGFFTQIAQQRAGGVDAGGAAGQNIALKAVVVGYILEEANKADVGTYAKAIDQFEASIAAGNAIFGPGQNLITNYSQGGAGFGTGVGQNTSGNGGVNGGGSGTQLTPNVETLSGTVFNGGLFFNAPSGTFIQTLNTGDVLNGTGTGGATVNATLQAVTAAGATVFPTLNNVSTLNLINLTTAGTTEVVDLSSSTAVKNIVVQQSTSALQINNNVGALTSLSVGNTGGNLVTVTSSGTALAGTADVLNLTSAASGTGNNNVAVAGYETINLTASGVTGASTTTNSIAIADANLTTLNVAGNSAVTVTGITGTATSALTTINAGGTGAGALAGALTIGSFGTSGAFTTVDNGLKVNTAGVGLGASTLTFTGSANADTLVLGAGLTSADTLNGGDGTDILGVVAADAPTAALGVTNFETVRFYQPVAVLAGTTATVFGAATAFSRANFGAAASTIDLGTGVADEATSIAGTISVTNLLTNNTVNFDYDAGTQTAGAVDANGVSIQSVALSQGTSNLSTAITAASDGAADVINIGLRDTDSVSTAGTTSTMALLTTTGFETVNLNLTGGAGVIGTNGITADGAAASTTFAFRNNDTIAITGIADAALTTLNIKGATNISLQSIIGNTTTSPALTSLATLDASGATGNVRLGTATGEGAAAGAFATANTGATITTGTGNDFVSLDLNNTGVLKAINLGSETVTTTATQTTSTFANTGDTLVLSSTAGVAGITIVDLSSTTDQIQQIAGSANAAAQLGIENIDPVAPLHRQLCAGDG